MKNSNMMWEAGGGSTESSSAAAVDGGGGEGVSGSSGRRKPSWRERENNRRRERRRRAVASQIYGGLRAGGNFNLPKHCDNNEVLKALCVEAGWIVEPDGTTYRKGCKPASKELGGTSANGTPSSSRNPSPPSSRFASPIPSYQPSPLSSACPSPTRYDPSIPSYPYALLHDAVHSNLRISNSAPVTPHSSSPTRHPPKQVYNFETPAKGPLYFPFNATSIPTSPIRGQRVSTPAPIPECHEFDSSTNDSVQWMNYRTFGNNNVSPTFNLVKPVAQWMPFADAVLDNKGKSKEFDCEKVAVKAWKGERIHEVEIDDLELTLASGNARRVIDSNN